MYYLVCTHHVRLHYDDLTPDTGRGYVDPETGLVPVFNVGKIDPTFTNLKIVLPFGVPTPVQAFHV
jgi:hypothetical protein